MDFTRFCSGTRGNVCNGVANRIFHIVDDCKDMNVTAKEVESCNGPSSGLIGSGRLTPTTTTCTDSCSDGKVCLDGLCYTGAEGLTSCVKYGIESNPGSFESTFSLPKRDSVIIGDGVCNPTPTCGKRRDKYDVSDESGPYIFKGATCGNGKCSEPLSDTPEAKNIITCAGYNGRQFYDEGTDPSLLEQTCYFASGNRHLVSVNYTCTKDEIEYPICSQDSTQADPDADELLCEACEEQMTSSGSGTYDTGRADRTKRCCGDDAGEGGFPYGMTAKRASGLSGAGAYPTEVCDDYYGATYSPAAAIDNNCDGNVNCADTSCRVTSGARSATGGWTQYLGPGGSVCCGGDADTTQCKNFLDPSSTSTDGVACGPNKECDCLLVTQVLVTPIRNDGPNNPYKVVALGGMRDYKTCIGNNTGGYDRFINITDLTIGNSYEISGRVYDINSGEDCSGYVNIGVYSSSPSPFPEIILTSGESEPRHISADKNYVVIAFSNAALVEDCLVSVKVVAVP
jgi:hypothetical protein